jgi:uncharacterized protein (TIGR02452 family)
MSGSALAKVAAETDRIVADGHYRTPTGVEIDISAAISESVAGTRHYLPGEAAPNGTPRGDACRIEVTNESTLDATARLAAQGTDEVLCLNFASARKPGGGYQRGAQAQEESLARASGLAECLRAVPEFYTFHRAKGDAIYSDRIIYSPGVPVFRDNHNRLLEQPYRVAMLTAAAPNASAVRTEDERAMLPDVLRRRARKVLEVASGHGHHRLVLGAWGCGVFGNDPDLVADVFATLLTGSGKLANRFSTVLFAVLDRQPNTRFTAFLRTFSSGT